MPVWFTQCGPTGHRIVTSFGREMSLSQHHMANDNSESCRDASMRVCFFLLKQKIAPGASKPCKYMNESHYSAGPEDPDGNGADGRVSQGFQLDSKRWGRRCPEREAQYIYIYIGALWSRKTQRAWIYTSPERHPHKCSRVLAIRAVQKIYFLTHAHKQRPYRSKEAGVTMVTHRTNSTLCILQCRNSGAGEGQPEALFLSLWKPKGIAVVAL